MASWSLSLPNSPGGEYEPLSHIPAGLCDRNPWKLTGKAVQSTPSYVGRSHTVGKRCHPEGSGQAGEVGLCETPEVQQSKVPGPKPGLEQSQAQPQAGGRRWLRAGFVFVSEKPCMTQQCALAAQKAKWIPSCILRYLASRLREGILPLFSEAPLAVLPPALGLPTGGHGTVGASPAEITKMTRGLVHPLCERQAGKFGAVEPGEGKAPGKHHSSISVSEGGLQESWRGTLH